MFLDWFTAIPVSEEKSIIPEPMIFLRNIEKYKNENETELDLFIQTLTIINKP